MDREQILDEIEYYIGGNVECVDPIDRMALTVFLRAKLNAVRNAALDEAAAMCRDQFPKYYGGNMAAFRQCAIAIESLKEPQP